MHLKSIRSGLGCLQAWAHEYINHMPACVLCITH
jgi:disulfide bond formation protein DsbB